MHRVLTLCAPSVPAVVNTYLPGTQRSSHQRGLLLRSVAALGFTRLASLPEFLSLRFELRLLLSRQHAENLRHKTCVRYFHLDLKIGARLSRRSHCCLVERPISREARALWSQRVHLLAQSLCALMEAIRELLNLRLLLVRQIDGPPQVSQNVMRSGPSGSTMSRRPAVKSTTPRAAFLPPVLRQPDHRQHQQKRGGYRNDGAQSFPIVCHLSLLFGNQNPPDGCSQAKSPKRSIMNLRVMNYGSENLPRLSVKAGNSLIPTVLRRFNRRKRRKESVRAT